MSDFQTFALLSGLNTVKQFADARNQAAAVEAQRRQQVAQIQARQAIEERRRREQLRRAQATQRARFAGGGISPQSGSAASMISGLAREVDRAIADGRAVDNLSIDRINANAGARRGSLLSQARSSLFDTFQSIAHRGINLLEK